MLMCPEKAVLVCVLGMTCECDLCIVQNRWRCLLAWQENILISASFLAVTLTKIDDSL